jgi:hypothetical protein
MITSEIAEYRNKRCLDCTLSVPAFHIPKLNIHTKNKRRIRKTLAAPHYVSSVRNGY